MIAFLRFAGIGTAAVWLGGTVLFVFVVDPVFGRPELLRLLGPLYVGEVGLQMAARFQMFQVLCASMGLVITLADWLYSGRALERRLVVMLALLLALGSLGRLWLVPKCRDLNVQAYLGPNGHVLRQALSPAQRQAEQALAVWEGLAVVLNVVSLAGTAFYLVRASSHATSGPRLFPSARLRI